MNLTIADALAVDRRSLVFGVCAGAATFLAVQIPLLLGSDVPAGASGSGWFLDSAANIRAITTAMLIGAAVLAAVLSRVLTNALGFWAGASGAMAVVLFATGAGNLFPIVLAFGAAFLAVATAAGTVGEAAVQLLWRRVVSGFAR